MSVLPAGRAMRQVIPDFEELRHNPAAYLSDGPVVIGPRQMYGLDNPATTEYAGRCLLARRLVEQGVRFVQVFMSGQPWDTHGNHNETTRRLAADMDRAAGALLTDLKARGLIDDTLVIEPAPGGAIGKEYAVIIDIGENGKPGGIALGGRYDDEYVRLDGRWRFSRWSSNGSGRSRC